MQKRSWEDKKILQTKFTKPIGNSTQPKYWYILGFFKRDEQRNQKRTQPHLQHSIDHYEKYLQKQTKYPQKNKTKRP